MSKEKIQAEINKLQAQLNVEEQQYVNALHANKEFEELKPVWLRVKFLRVELQKNIEMLGSFDEVKSKNHSKNCNCCVEASLRRIETGQLARK